MAKCSPQLKEAIEGIQFTYKLDSVISGLSPKSKMSASQLSGYLRKKGVSPREISQSGILETSETKAMPISYWENKVKLGKHHIRTTESKNLGYADITVGSKGISTDTYKETLSTVKEPLVNSPKVTHFDNEIDRINKKDEFNELQKELENIDMYDPDDPDLPSFMAKVEKLNLGDKDSDRTLLGWRRTHEDTIGGKPTTILNEFQSDWEQTERSGRGTFEKNALTYEDLEKLKKERLELHKQSRMYANELEALPHKTIDGIPINKTKEYEELDNSYRDTYKAYMDMGEKIRQIKLQDIIADFPMSENKHHQFQIVGAIDEAIKNGTNRVAIPIERENELVGTEGVTKFYNSLNKKVLPDIRKKLEKQGMRLKLSKESSSGGFKDYAFDNIRDNILDIKGVDWFESNYDFIINDINLALSGKAPKTKEVKDSIEYLSNEIKTGNNTFHIIDIVPIKGKKVNWDVYSILGAIGLGEIADKYKGIQEETK